MYDETLTRCGWPGSDPLYVKYHDEEWGVPVRDDAELFERLMLEGFQAGLSWITILRKREAFHAAFDGWDAEKIVNYGEDDIARLLNDPGIVRNRLKVNGAVRNARAYLQVRDELGSFSDYLWDFVGGQPLVNRPATLADIPPISPEATAMSKALKKRNFTFVGPTIIYAFMQSVGMVNDHVVGCFCLEQMDASIVV
ncbi:MAG TPA: DNA-3-methyladenine glycosylase I [Thermomicrobiales bacterium]|nr:DNA-3-methyladenine glycosylase I [Thermomicrobiales bacterium]